MRKELQAHVTYLALKSKVLLFYLGGFSVLTTEEKVLRLTSDYKLTQKPN